MTTRIGINGFGRIGRLVVRAVRDHPSLQLVHINEVKGGPITAAHLLEFDSVHGRYPGSVHLDGDTLVIDNQRVSFSEHDQPEAIDWNKYGVDLVLECSGKFKTTDTVPTQYVEALKRAYERICTLIRPQISIWWCSNKILFKIRLYVQSFLVKM